MFDRIAHRYDLLNRILSLGTDQRWRRRTAAALVSDRGEGEDNEDRTEGDLAGGDLVLDIAAGTGDLSFVLASRFPMVGIVGVDPSEGMLSVGRRKAAARGLDDRITFVRADAQDLPFAAGTFAATCMAFGIRNVPDRARALREAARVTRQGGTIAILELSEPRSGLLAAIARLHIHYLVPRIGAVLSGAREYRYLHQSIAAFPPPAEFAALMEQSGIASIRAFPLTFGVSCLFTGKPAPA
ncbi:MAG: ubiquinone/menaquinone biosynthesis methyltransferase [Pseudomonadota bacterium]